jgi:hypothetical protein
MPFTWLTVRLSILHYSFYIKTIIFYYNHIHRGRHSLPQLVSGYILHLALPACYLHEVQIIVQLWSPLSYYLPLLYSKRLQYTNV